MPALLLTALLLPLLLGCAFLLGRYLRGRLQETADLTPVTRQHLELYRGGQLPEAAVEAAKERYREWIARGDLRRVELSLQAGTQFVVRVRALTEIGSDEAGQVLERVLLRRLTDNEVEQAWYWIDLASSLRSLNREESLPLLLRCVAENDEFPLVHYFAAETVSFLGFGGFAKQFDTIEGRAALRLLHRALEGMRFGVPPHVMAEARLGELIEAAWDERPAMPDALLTRLFVEVQRQLRRGDVMERGFGGESFEEEAYHMQVSRLLAMEPAIEDYLQEARLHLPSMLRTCPPEQRRDVLGAMNDLRLDAATAILPLLQDREFEPKDLATAVLRWSRQESVGPLLRGWVQRTLPVAQRGMKRLRSWAPGRSSVPGDFPYDAVLFALRGHPSPQTEQLLLAAAHDWDPTYRGMAISSLGWWEPYHRPEVILHLQDARFDPNADVRHAARCAFARLGERQALQWFRQALRSDNQQRVLEAIQTVATECLTLLWPDLDELADDDDPDLAFLAREALEQLQEDLDHRMGWRS